MTITTTYEAVLNIIRARLALDISLAETPTLRGFSATTATRHCVAPSTEHGPLSLWRLRPSSTKPLPSR